MRHTLIIGKGSLVFQIVSSRDFYAPERTLVG